ncbi:hypothetical protein CISG_09097 [Coccidioides immitis RMSCC 3703]|uniref:Uncharacterized protein n=1 Tax=Coccidioides immitis RMSCC 3703 TaxID=454286 RepID=A0A0J8RAV0_COCIT|nr:hypothetical protein CISG_09097 [Coccidioides immitis RMSCC 3703]
MMEEDPVDGSERRGEVDLLKEYAGWAGKQSTDNWIKPPSRLLGRDFAMGGDAEPAQANFQNNGDQACKVPRRWRVATRELVCGVAVRASNRDKRSWVGEHHTGGEAVGAIGVGGEQRLGIAWNWRDASTSWLLREDDGWWRGRGEIDGWRGDGGLAGRRSFGGPAEIELCGGGAREKLPPARAAQDIRARYIQYRCTVVTQGERKVREHQLVFKSLREDKLVSECYFTVLHYFVHALYTPCFPTPSAAEHVIGPRARCGVSVAEFQTSALVPLRISQIQLAGQDHQ